MSLPTFNTQDRSFALLQSRWSALLDPLLANPMSEGVFLKGVELVSGDNTVNHKLQRPIQGYLITDMVGGYAEIYRKESSMPNLTMVLNASAPTTINLMVF